MLDDVLDDTGHQRAASREVVKQGAARDAGADFVKTSTGFGPGGATVADVMSSPAQTAGPEDSVTEAAGRLALAAAEKAPLFAVLMAAFNVLLHGGMHLKFIGDGLMAVFHSHSRRPMFGRNCCR